MFKLFQTLLNSESELNERLNSETTSGALEQQQSFALQLSKADNLWKQGKISEAISLYCQIIELQPNATELYGQLSAFLKQQEELALAYKRLAVQLKQQGEVKDAAICYRQAIVLQAINYSTEEKYLQNQNGELVDRQNQQTPTLADSAFSFLPLSSPQPVNKRIIQISLDDSYEENWLNLQANERTSGLQTSGVAEEKAKIYLQQALKYCDLQEWKQAAMACQQAINIAPNMAEAYKLWGNALQRMGKTPEAMDCYTKALEIEPDLAEVYARIGSLYARQKQWQQALEYYQKAIIIRPNFSQAYSSLAKIWYLVGESEKANFCRKQALKLESSRLNSTSGEEEFSPAEQLQENPIPEGQTAITKVDRVEKYQKIAQKFEKQHKWQEAAIYYRKALEINIDELSSSLAFPETKQKDRFHKLEKLQQLMQKNSEEKTDLTTISGLAQNLSPVEVEEVSPANLLSTSSVDLETKIARTKQITLPTKSKQIQLNRAIQRYLKQAELKPDSAQIQTDLGSLYAKKRQWNAAIAAYHRAIKINDRYAQAYLNLAKVLAKVGKNRESVGYMYRALTLEPELFSAKEYFYLGKSFIEQGKLRRGMSYCLKAIKLDPNYLEAYHHLGTVMSQQGQSQKAINYFRQAIERNPQEPQSYYLLGQELAAQRRWDEAVKAYSQVLEIQPRFPHASEKLNYALAEKLKQDFKTKQN